MGSGKSAVGVVAAHRAHVPFFDLDRMIEKAAGTSITRIFATRGEAEFRGLESELLPSALKPDAVAALGGGAVVDDANWHLIREMSMSVYLDVPFEVIWDRVGRAEHRPLVAGRSRLEVADLFERRRSRYEEADHRVDANRMPGAVAADLLALWSA